MITEAIVRREAFAISMARTKEEVECQLCCTPLTDQVAGHQLVESSVWHIFHVDCLQLMFKQEQRCPLCRCKVTNARGFYPGGTIPASVSEMFHNGEKKLFDTRFIEACRFGNLSVARAFLESGEISEDAYNEGLWTASARGHVSIVRLMLATGMIQDSVTIGIALQQATDKNHFAVVKVLLAAGEIDQNQHLLAVRSAALITRNPSMLIALLAHRPIDPISRDALIRAASRNGSASIIEVFLSHQAVPRKSLNEALSVTTNDETRAVLLAAGAQRAR